jgi:hypothetical protein
MPDLKKMLEEARKEESKRSPKKITKGIRPDKILRGEISLEPARKNTSPAKGQQLNSDSPAKGQQLNSDSPANKIQLDSNKTPDWTAVKTAIRQQKDSDSPAKWSVDALSGKEAAFIKILFQRCKNVGSLTTEKISSENLCGLLKISTRRLRNLFERLIEKELLLVISSKRGNGSWRQITLPERVYRELTLNDLDSNSPAIRPLIGQPKGQQSLLVVVVIS